MKKILIRSIFLLFLVTTPLKSQPIAIERGVLVKSIHNALFLIIKVIEHQGSTFYHIYHLQEKYGQYWGTHLEQLDSVIVNEQKQSVKTTSFEEYSHIPTEFYFIKWVTTYECNFKEF